MEVKGEDEGEDEAEGEDEEEGHDVLRRELLSGALAEMLK